MERVATPVMEVFTQSVHSLMAAFALLTPSDCFLTVFDRMGSFFMTVGRNSCNCVTVIIQSATDILTNISSVQKAFTASVGVFCYYRNVVQTTMHDAITTLGDVLVEREETRVEMDRSHANVKTIELTTAAHEAMLQHCFHFVHAFCQGPFLTLLLASLIFVFFMFILKCWNEHDKRKTEAEQQERDRDAQLKADECESASASASLRV